MQYKVEFERHNPNLKFIKTMTVCDGKMAVAYLAAAPVKKTGIYVYNTNAGIELAQPVAKLESWEEFLQWKAKAEA